MVSKARVCRAVPINKLDAVFADPQVRARGMRLDMAHPLAGTVPQMAPPMKFSATPAVPERAPPLLAEHTVDVLRDRLGLDAQAIAALAACGRDRAAGATRLSHAGGPASGACRAEVSR